MHESIDLPSQKSEGIVIKENVVSTPTVCCSPLVLPTIIFSQFAGVTLWFAPNAVISQIEGFGSSEIAALTSAVQIGFIFGTFSLTYFAIADRFSAPFLFLFSCVVGSLLNFLCTTSNEFAIWVLLRSLVGVCLAGVYPVGMKIAAKQYPCGLGARLGAIIGALTLGTAFPWFIRGIGEGKQIPFEWTLITVSILSVVGGSLMPLVMLPNGERIIALKTFFCKSKTDSKETLVFGKKTLQAMWSERTFRTAMLGYFAHNFELYGFWTFGPVLIEAHSKLHGSVMNLALTNFLTIGIGAVSSVLAGIWSLNAGNSIYPGSAVAALTALIVSCICCLLAPLYKYMPAELFFFYMLVWGFAVIADSGQFSTLCAQYAPKEFVGTALTLITCVGFSITVMSIQLLNALLKAGLDPGWVLFVLFFGPIIGIFICYPVWPLHRLWCRFNICPSTEGKNLKSENDTQHIDQKEKHIKREEEEQRNPTIVHQSEFIVHTSKQNNINTDSETKVEELHNLKLTTPLRSTWKTLIAPLDEDKFVISFALSDDPQSALDFFDKYGFVVIRDVLTESECDLTVSEFWDTHRSKGLDRSNPNTWQTFWNTQKFGKLGIIGRGNDLTSIKQLENRTNEKVYRAFSMILQEKELYVDHDRLGIMRPTKQVDFGDGILKEVESWRTISRWLHLDCNPFQGYASIGSFANDLTVIDFKKTLIIQGLLTLSNARVEDGGFHCVPGSHKFSFDWSVTYKEQNKHPSNCQIQQDDPLRTKIQQIPIKKGCALIWNSLLMHGNHPNHSNAFRACQYIRFLPTHGTPYSALAPDEKFYPEKFIPSNLGKKLLGIEPWK